MFPITTALTLWGSSLQDKCMILHSDNFVEVHIINNQTCKDKGITFLVRRLVIACMTYNIWVKAEHIPGKQNTLADMLSRFQIQEFRRSAPHMDKLPTPIPTTLLEHV